VECRHSSLVKGTSSQLQQQQKVSSCNLATKLTDSHSLNACTWSGAWMCVGPVATDVEESVGEIERLFVY
jgi:hypothetical protein